MTTHDALLTSVAADTINARTVLFLGTTDGRIKKVHTHTHLASTSLWGEQAILVTASLVYRPLGQPSGGFSWLIKRVSWKGY
jgi:hypothetical protein